MSSYLGTLLILLFLYSSPLKAQELAKLPDWALGNFIRPQGVNPIVSPDNTANFYCPMLNKNIDWKSNDTFNPAATVRKGKIILLYRSEDKSGVGIGKRTSRIGYAESKDGIHFKHRTEPVLYPTEDSQKEFEWPGGCEDPRVAITENGVYIMMYTQWNRKQARIAVATSKNLIEWEKHGAIFREAHNGKFSGMWSKSASIITKISNGKQVIAKINGKYWMYWGEAKIYLAYSEDLLNWIPVTDSEGKLKVLVTPRKGHFDSIFTECGPPALITEKGILLVYNGKNSVENGDKQFAGGAYCAGQLLFDLNDPAKVISRLDKPFFYPTEAFEQRGQYATGTVFTEGLVYFKKKWFLYYGAADSKVGVAIFNPSSKK